MGTMKCKDEIDQGDLVEIWASGVHMIGVVSYISAKHVILARPSDAMVQCLTGCVTSDVKVARAHIGAWRYCP